MTDAERHEIQLWRLVGILEKQNSVAAKVYAEIALYLRKREEYVAELEGKLEGKQ